MPTCLFASANTKLVLWTANNKNVNNNNNCHGPANLPGKIIRREKKITLKVREKEKRNTCRNNPTQREGKTQPHTYKHTWVYLRDSQPMGRGQQYCNNTSK